MEMDNEWVRPMDSARVKGTEMEKGEDWALEIDTGRGEEEG